METGGDCQRKIINKCNNVLEGGGWTVLQRRGDFGGPENFFLKKWDDYRDGFGNPEKV